MGCLWLFLVLLCLLIFGWDLLLFYTVYIILIGVFYWLRSKKVDPVPKWELGLAIVCSALLTLGIFTGFTEYKQYRQSKEFQERLDAYKKLSSETKQDEVYSPPVTPSVEVHHSSSSKSTNDEIEEYYDEEESLGFDEGYEDGYQDGRWRSPGFSKRSYDYDYEEGYAQGYYEAAHDEPDYKEGEEYDW